MTLKGNYEADYTRFRAALTCIKPGACALPRMKGEDRRRAHGDGNDGHSAEPTGGAGEFWGGLASMLVALPSSIAFGVVVYSALGPERAADGALAGIIGAAVLGIVAPLVGRNGGFITAPCAPAAAVLAAMAAGFAAQTEFSAERILALLALTALVSALLQGALGAVRAGRLIKFIPCQAVSGYLSGVALVIALGQLPGLLGLPGDVALAQGLLTPALWNWTGIAVGAATIVAMIGAPALTEKVPAAIVGLPAEGQPDLLHYRVE
jgi:SulP family sulfate permease